MFNRYWRTYPWGMQVFLFIMMVVTLASFANFLALALGPKLSGLSWTALTRLTAASVPGAVRARLLMEALTHAGTFALPGLLFAAVAHPRIRNYLGLRTPGKAVHWLLVTGIMLGLIPVFLWGEAWIIKHSHLGSWADELQAQNDNMIGAFLRLNGAGDLLLQFFVLALLPAFGEEVIFRGVLLRLLHRRISTPLFITDTDVPQSPPDAQRSMIAPVVLTALLFSAIHLSPYGFVFIFIAGCVLALVYFLTGSLLCSIWAHFLYNGAQVALITMGQHNSDMKRVLESNSIPLPLALAGLGLFAACFYFLVKTQTPLPADWSNDFKDEPAGIDAPLL